MYSPNFTHDYISELNRLFPRNENDTLQTPTFSSPLQANRSSSSADSTSPESFPDRSTLFLPRNRMDIFSTTPSELERPQQLFETPFTFRRQRPIVGRKILANTDYQSVLDTSQSTAAKPFESISEDRNLLWATENFPQTPTTSRDENSYTQNLVYELFPSKPPLQFKTPAKASSPLQINTNVSPSFINSSPNSQLGHSPLPMYRRVSPPFVYPSNVGPSSSNVGEHIGQVMCTFCRKNGETPLVYMTHKVKEKIGNKFVVTCPILRSHVCPTCGATGDNAHTMTYCPILRSSNNGIPLRSTTITLKNTRIKSNGRRRF